MDLVETLKKVKDASRKLVLFDDQSIGETLKKLADVLEARSGDILKANSEDLSHIEESDSIYDRILLDEGRITAIADGVREISDTESPIDKIIDEKTLENGLELKKVRTPLGVIGVIFEARPNVVIDIFALCFKSKNCCVLKGGSQSEKSNEVLVEIIESVLENKNIIELLPNDRAVVGEFLKMDKYVDVIVPRGGKGLIDFVRTTSLIPVIETGAGVVHTYFDKDGDTNMGAEIIFNAKTDRPSVCNALDTLIVHSSRISDLPVLCKKLGEADVQIRADELSFNALEGYENLTSASDDDFGNEYLGLAMSIKVVDSLEEAVDHINSYGSGHSEAIVTENKEAADKFLKSVDAAAVYVNASTRFTDGGVYGLGAEVGISTQKLHARGPMGIRELTSYKWQIRGNGQVRA
ncbi:glutamate-5-semialdehyde dehydrogenase [Candidatus Peregrinibacteria bacterium]|nr:glutamate-5-semialdehyde dehydrogenase [Candidatus Peregrinibacteria bacterium]MBT7736087.1 glutamate-5-semialdehyde dehydrogenase [Candidatus Peregrinibacteria bacterium]